MSGFNTIGAALGGLPASEANSYQTGVLSGARASDVLEQARQRRDQNIALASITPDATAAYQQDPTGQGAATLLSALIQAGRDPAQSAQFLKDNQGTGMRQAAFAAAQQPGVDISSLNPMLAVIDGKPVAVTGVEGNTLVDKYVDPNQQAAVGGNVPTSLGQAMIGTQGAEAAAANARAADSYANAARARAGIGADKAANWEITPDTNGNLVRVNKLDGTTAPVTMADGTPMGSLSKTTPTAPPENLLDAVIGKVNNPVSGVATPDPTGTQQFLAWQQQQAATDPRYNNSAFALARYAANAPIGSNMAQTVMSDKGKPTVVTQPIAASGTSPDLMAAIAAARTKGDTQPGYVPPASAIQQALTGTTANAPPGVTPAPPAPSASAPAGVAQPKTAADFNALPKGTQFINPSDGSLRVKN